MPEHPSPSPSRSPSPPGYVVVANAGAGSTRTTEVGAALTRLAAAAPTELRWTEKSEQLLAVIGDLDDAAQLVVAGGDGSVHHALATVTELDRTDRPVGIIPLGTGNDFARNHGLPLDPAEAAEVVVAGHVADVGAMTLQGTPADRAAEAEDRPHVVANNLHVGLGVRAAATASRWKGALARFAYPAATAYHGATGETVELSVTVDDEPVWDGPLLAALVLLGPSMGGGVEMVTDQRRDLDVVLVEPASTTGRAGLVAAALRGRVPDSDRAWHHRGTGVTIDGGDGVEVNLDGETIEFVSPVTLTHRPAAWRILVPNPS